MTRSSVDPEQLFKSGKAYREVGLAWGKVCGSNGMGMPADNFANVVDDALEHVDADALINVATSTHREPYLPVVMFIPLPGNWCTKIQGTAIKFIEDEGSSKPQGGIKEVRPLRFYEQHDSPYE